MVVLESDQALAVVARLIAIMTAKTIQVDTLGGRLQGLETMTGFGIQALATLTNGFKRRRWQTT